jgi:hypothetical protein
MFLSVYLFNKLEVYEYNRLSFNYSANLIGIRILYFYTVTYVLELKTYYDITYLM